MHSCCNQNQQSLSTLSLSLSCVQTREEPVIKLAGYPKDIRRTTGLQRQQSDIRSILSFNIANFRVKLESYRLELAQAVHSKSVAESSEQRILNALSDVFRKVLAGG